MKFARAFLVFSRLVPLAGLMAVLVTREAGDWYIIPAVALTVAGMALPNSVGEFKLHKKFGTALSILALVFAVIDFFYIGGSLIMAGTHYLIIMLCVRLLLLDGRRDYLQLYLVSFFLLLASTALNTDIYFIFVFIMFFISLTWALILMTVKTEAEAAGKTVINWRVGRFFFGGTALLTLVASFFTVIIFLVIPRIGIGFFSHKAGGLIKISGFSDRVELGSMGEVLNDPSVVMRVRFPETDAKPAYDIYWRGRTFDSYSGKKWEDTINIRKYARRGGLGFEIGPQENGPRLVQEINLEPLDTMNIFSVYSPYAVEGRFFGLYKDHARAIYLPAQPVNRITYTVYSRVYKPGEEELAPQEAGLPEEYAEQYTKVPKGSEKIAELAQKITAGETRPYAKTVKLLSYLQKNYEYTLDPNMDSKLNPVEDFLFHAKGGYCGHFASSMVIMLRSVGVPARLVSGFSGGDWNDIGRYMIVREQNAHTWVEVYFPDSGWVPFDPTPDSARSAGSTGSIAKAFDLMKFKWDRYIVYFSMRDQLVGLGVVSDIVYQARYQFKGKSSIPDGATITAYVKAHRSLLPYALGLVGLVALVAMLYMKKYKKKLERRRSGIEFYNEMEKILARKGLTRPPGMTPSEFARYAEESGIPGVVYLTGTYNLARYGGLSISNDQIREIKTRLRRLKDAKAVVRGAGG